MIRSQNYLLLKLFFFLFSRFRWILLLILKFSSKIRELKFNREKLGRHYRMTAYFDKDPDDYKSISIFVLQNTGFISFKRSHNKMIETSINKLTKINRKLLNCQLSCVFYRKRSKRWSINFTEGNEWIELKKKTINFLIKLNFYMILKNNSQIHIKIDQ